MAAQQVDQVDAASINSNNTKEEVAEAIAGVVENGNEPSVQQPSDESSEPPTSESVEAACIDSLLEQKRELSPEPELVKPKITFCGVCKEKPGKYKCARCYLP